jgi:hypothetical protein
MALVSLVAVAKMLTAWAVGTITSRRHRQGMSSAAGSGVWP